MYLHISWGNFAAFIKTCTYLYLGCPMNLGLPVFKGFQITVPSNPYQFTIHNSNSACYCLIDSLTSKWWNSVVCVCMLHNVTTSSIICCQFWMLLNTCSSHVDIWYKLLITQSMYNIYRTCTIPVIFTSIMFDNSDYPKYTQDIFLANLTPIFRWMVKQIFWYNDNH